MQVWKRNTKLVYYPKSHRWWWLWWNLSGWRYGRK